MFKYNPDILYIALTFDDGYLDHYHIARLLARAGIKATFFLITHLTTHPDNGKPLLTSKPNMIKEIYKMGHEIGSHSCTHVNLVNVSSQRLDKELRDSKLFLENLLDTNIYGFAYPKGAVTLRVVEMVKRYYSYGRVVHDFGEDIWNVDCHDKYRIRSFGSRHLTKLPLKFVLHYTSIKPVLMLHHEGPVKLLLLIRSLKLLYPKVKFVTMREMAELIEENLQAFLHATG